MVSRGIEKDKFLMGVFGTGTIQATVTKLHLHPYVEQRMLIIEITRPPLHDDERGKK